MATEWDIKKVLISDEVDDQCIEILNSVGIETVKQTKLTKEQLKTEISKYDGLIVRSATKVTADIIEAGTRLKVIGRAGTGVDNIDVPTATQRGILVVNTPGGNTLSAAEHTCAMLMAVSRHVSQGTACIRSGHWEQKKSMIGNELFGKTLAIIGLGRIGREVAHRMQSFGMKTVGFDPLVSVEESREFGVEWLSLEELWPISDYITLHTPLIAKTKYLINSSTLSKCRKGVRIVNCARGGIINEDDLLDALNSGHCAGAGLDVFEHEPPLNTTLLEHPLLTSTPHLGASTVEAQTRVAVEIAQNFVDLVQRNSVNGAINGKALSLTADPEIKPWFRLSRDLAKLGRILLRTKATAVSSLKLITQGNTLKSAGCSLTAASLVELFGNEVGQTNSSSLNPISASAFASSAGIEVQTTHEDSTSHRVTSSVKLIIALRSDSVPASEQHQQLKPLLSITLTGTIIQEKSYWVSVNGAEFSHPVALIGSQLICRCCSTSKKAKCLSAANDALESYDDVSILAFTATVAAPSDDAVWGSLLLSRPVEIVPASFFKIDF